MPDADIVHDKLPWLYQRPYRELCEGKDRSQECAWTMMKALLKDIQKKGAPPIVLANQMGELLDRAIKNVGDRSSLNWTVASKQLDTLAREANVVHYSKELVLRAGKSVIHDLRYGGKLKTSNLSQTVTYRYMEEVYRSSFKERIPLTSEHYLGVDRGVLEGRIEEIEPDLSKTMEKWAHQVNKGTDLENLRRPRRSNINKVDLDEDLL